MKKNKRKTIENFCEGCESITTWTNERVKGEIYMWKCGSCECYSTKDYLKKMQKDYKVVRLG